jgi:hypothetical protein
MSPSNTYIDKAMPNTEFAHPSDSNNRQGDSQSQLAKDYLLDNSNQEKVSENKTPKRMKIPTTAFDSWWSQYGKPSATLKEQVAYITQHYQIDPLLGDITIHYQNGRWVPHITMDGWMKIINQHPAFCGIDFQEAQELIDGVPQWISCTIYRQDRVIPITVREYYLELKQESSLWLEIPRRLLRFRSMQQCARLALGISTPEFSIQPLADNKPPGNMASSNFPSESPPPTQLEKIKTKIMKNTSSPPSEII